MAKEAWGLDISQSSLKAVKLALNEEEIKVLAVEVIEFSSFPDYENLTETERVKKAISIFVKNYKPKRDVIACSIPGHSTFNRIINVIPPSDAELPDYVRMEAKEQIPFNIDEIVWTYKVVEKDYQPGQEREVILFAIKKEIVEQFLTKFEDTGCEVDILQFAPVSVYNYVKYITPMPRFAIIDMGSNNSDLILVDENKFWIRNMRIAGDELTKHLQNKLGVSYSRAEEIKKAVKTKEQGQKIFIALKDIIKVLVEDISRSVAWYKSVAKDTNFDTIIVTGNGSLLPNFASYIGTMLNLKPVRITKLHNFTIHDKINEEVVNKNIQGIAVACGLALQGLGVSDIDVNLLPEGLIKQKQLSRKKPFLAIGGILLLLASIFQLMKNNDMLAQTKKDLSIIDEVLDKTDFNESKYMQLVMKEPIIQKDIKDLVSIKENRSLPIMVFNAINESLPNNEVEKDNNIWLLDLGMGKTNDNYLFCEMFVGCKPKLDNKNEPSLPMTTSFINDNLILKIVENLYKNYNITVSNAPLVNPDSDELLDVLKGKNQNKNNMNPSDGVGKYYRYRIQFKIYQGLNKTNVKSWLPDYLIPKEEKKLTEEKRPDENTQKDKINEITPPDENVKVKQPEPPTLTPEVKKEDKPSPEKPLKEIENNPKSPPPPINNNQPNSPKKED